MDDWICQALPGAVWYPARVIRRKRDGFVNMLYNLRCICGVHVNDSCPLDDTEGEKGESWWSVNCKSSFRFCFCF